MIKINSVLPDYNKWLTIDMSVIEGKYLLKWLAQQCEGLYLVTDRDVKALVGSPIGTDSPFAEEMFSAPVIEKHGYLIGFENQADATKFILYWDGNTDIPLAY